MQNLNDLVEAALNSDKIFNLIKIELKKENVPVYADVIAKRIGKPEQEVLEDCKQSNDNSIFMAEISDKTILLTREAHEQYYRKVIDEVEQWHRKNPILEEGLELSEFYGKFRFVKNGQQSNTSKSFWKSFNMKGRSKR